MQEAMAYRSHFPTSFNGRLAMNNGRRDEVRKMVEENAVIVFSRKGCCMSHVVKRLLQGLGANPAVYEVEESFEDDVVRDCAGGKDAGVQLPMVFIGGRCFGGLDRIMATHITGELTPLLKQAGALWL
ncbi:Thioredoxin superfamily protein [Perilla frutescens var. hirtella]|uniref:Thioredoxin superfamily protein n=1 Tax=Perilla frutescens var. hirtella TaxID=608512 RepID=A0AAD4JM79_PERFH|nr:Thioredoxin superfamily protein [Perilla frutescens var. hirtella]